MRTKLLSDTKAQGSVILFFIGAMIAVIVALQVTWPVIDSVMNQTTFSTNQYAPIVTPAPPQSPEPLINVGESVKTTNLNIHAEKTAVSIGEDILIKLSAVNLITKKTMHIQIILVPPSGMSVTSSDFVFSGAGQYTSDYRIEPGQGRDIEIRLNPNQAGNFKIEGRAVYYFGDDIINSEDYSLSVPITVISNGVQTETPKDKSSSDIIAEPAGNSETAKTLMNLTPLILVLAVIIAFIRPML